MIHANKAKEITKENQGCKESEAWLNRTNDEIIQAASLGRSSIRISHRNILVKNESYLFNYLKNRGYKVKIEQYDGDWEISWNS